MFDKDRLVSTERLSRSYWNLIIGFFLNPSPVPDPGFPQEGGPTSNVQAQTYYLGHFFPKTAWNWKLLNQCMSLAAPPRSILGFLSKSAPLYIGVVFNYIVIFVCNQWRIHDFPLGGSTLLFGQIFLKTAWKWRKIGRGDAFEIFYVDSPQVTEGKCARSPVFKTVEP